MAPPRVVHPDSDSESSFKSFDDEQFEQHFRNMRSRHRWPEEDTASTTTGKDTTSHTSSRPSRTQPKPSNPAKDPTPPPAPAPVERFPPEEEASLLTESNTLKDSANTLFGQGSYETAIQTYDRALASCPNYLDYELAVLRSNVAACYVKLEEWKQAVDSAEKGLECLERLEPLPRVKSAKKANAKAGSRTAGHRGAEGNSSANVNSDDGEDDTDAAGGIEEVDEQLASRIEALQRSGRTLDQVRKLQVKLLLRRAKGRTGTGSWAALQGAEEDYQTLLAPTMQPVLTASDRRTVTDAARALTPQLNAAREREMADMMGKLKGLGNSILKPFGLSTENFQFVKDEKSGGYSMNFDQNAGGAK